MGELANWCWSPRQKCPWQLDRQRFALGVQGMLVGAYTGETPTDAPRHTGLLRGLRIALDRQGLQDHRLLGPEEDPVERQKPSSENLQLLDQDH